MYGKELYSKGSIVWASQEEAAILVRLLLVLSVTKIEKKLFKKHAGANLKDKDYTVFEDIPKELYELRKKQNKLKHARQDGLKVFFLVKKVSGQAVLLTVNLYH